MQGLDSHKRKYPKMRAVGITKYLVHILSLFLISLALIIPTSTAASSGNETDRLALLAFKANIVDDPLGVLDSWNNSIHVCLWYGITCGRLHKRVTSLNLSSQHLVGTLSPHIGNMSFLSEIILYDNYLQGVIPQEVDRLFRLKVLNLGQNALEGNIPDTLGQINSLVIVDISLNKLSGLIPTSVFNLSLLTALNLSSNQLRGSLPSEIGSTLPNLKKFQLSYNNFTGSIPVSLSNASKLQAIDFQSNNLSGPISVDFGRLLYLQILRLSNNNLGYGEQGHLIFLDTLTNCSSLRILELGTNNFQGSLPRSIANLSSELTIISLADNQISGSIPSEISKYINLIFLSLERNKFTGIIPPEIVRLGKLQRVLLSNNRLSGNIPASIGNLSLLDEIHFEDNELHGTIPPSFGNCPMLVLLDLSQNHLSGTLPNKFFDISPFSVKLNLSRNHLVGSLPADIGALKTLVALDVSENEFSGLIPDTLDGCITLGSLYMQGNFIQGDISQSMKKLRGMQYVDLSRNNLSGEIPIFFETLSLIYLNLSWNNLEGEVHTKGLFANASAFSVAGNKRLCGGILELQLARCSSDRSHKHKMSWVRVIIFIGSIIVILTIGFLLYLSRIKKPHPESDISISPIRLSYSQLREATNGFLWTNIISRGDSGLVYKGKLGKQYHKADIAIKVFNTQNKAAVNRFINECEALRNIRHKNIVKILSMCASIKEKNNEFKAIVYRFMEHGSIEKWQQSTSKISYDKLYMPQILNLGIKMNIAIDVASALDYLHNQLANPLVYCNLKPSNILLDTDMRAHVSNFGLAKFEFSGTSFSSIDGIVEMTGYVPPEYGLGGMVSLSTKGDVYSYGIFLLEMLTGKKTTDPMFHEGFTLQNFVSSALCDGVKEIIDPAILHELSRDDAAQVEDCLSMLFNIGVKCASELPQFRPEISDVLSMLETFRIILQINTGRSETNANKSSPPAAVLTAQRNLKSLLTKKMAPTSSTISMLPSVTVSYMDLHKATNGLCITHLVGAGGYGSVYRGTFHQEHGRLLLRDSGIEDETGTTVAIKVFNLQRRGAAKSFKTEYETLRNIHHPNLVKIITTCTDVDQEGHDFRAIVYEFMDHGSLAMWLHPTNKAYHDGPIKPRLLSLHARINIATDVARALNYLHHQCENCIIHCDLKPSNILLDKNMVARIADFGLATSLSEFPSLNKNSSSTGIRGTAGYIAPEYGLGCKMTTKGDIYSFGILLLEMLTSKMPTHRMFRGGLNLHSFVWMSLPDHVIDITDPLMKATTSVNEGNGKQVEECLTRMFNVGLACSNPSSKDRPDIRAVLRELESIRTIYHTFICYFPKWCRPEKMTPISASNMMLPSVTVSYMDLHKATNGLSLTNLVGAGGFGSVYKGTFHQASVRLLLRNSGIEDGIGTAFAIKVFNLERRGAESSFNTEYKTLRNIHHSNLVKLITTCTTVDQEGRNFRAILYEFMDHGSLEMWLHPTNKTCQDGPIKPQTLSLHARMNVATDVACGLSYLHHQCENCIIHCDIKPSNILLDKNMVARIADFRLAISLPESLNPNQSNSSTGLRGTTGYIAPEYGLGCKMTTKGDTYSFGILLLEMLTGIRPTHRMFRGGLNLHNFVSLALPNNVINITDPLMKVMTSVNEGDVKRVEEYLTRMFNIGLACSKPLQKDRPDMRAVLCELESIRNNL